MHLLHPKYAKTIAEFVNDVYLPYLSKQLQSSARLGIVWDRYDHNSLKSQERLKRGTGRRRHVEPSGNLPSNWADFLRRDENKEELFSFLAKASVILDTPDQVISTFREQVICKYAKSIDRLAPCNHEEADMQIFVHMIDGIADGNSKFLIRTVDTDVVVLAVEMSKKISIEELWILFWDRQKVPIPCNP